MKKLTAILLVLVLVFTTSATTLAAGPAVGGDGDSGVTNVNVEVDSTNISVTVPLNFTIVAKIEGGPASVPAGYTIKNNSTIPVKVDTIKVVLNTHETWTMKNAPIEVGKAPAAPAVNEICLSVNGQVLAENDTGSAPTTPASWNISAKSGDTVGTLDLPIVASTSKLNTTTTESNLITITYVISAGRHSAT